MIDPFGSKPTLRSPTPCTECTFEERSVVDARAEIVTCRYCGANRPEYRWLDHSSLCPGCHRTKRVVARDSNGQLGARCAACLAPRGSLPYEQYGAAFNRAPANPNRRSAHQLPTEGAREIAARMLDGECVHCALRRIGIRPRYVAVPPRFDAPRVFKQLDLNLRPTSAGQPFVPLPVDAVRAHEQDDHLIPLSLHDAIESDLTPEQSRRARVVWVVASCGACNNARRGKLEDVGYLTQVFGIFVHAAEYDYAVASQEIGYFVAVVKTAHMFVKRENEWQRRYSALRGSG